VYNIEAALGPNIFPSQESSVQYVRQDLQIKNCRGMRLECSFWTSTENLGREGIPVVIYCAGNCGSRCDALDAVQLLLPLGISVFGFDFCGSGLSDGEYVSLGFYEQKDLKAVTTYLRHERNVGRIGLWGRSMGSATAIMYASKRTGISGIIADSPFSSLEQVMIDLVRSNAKIPTRMIKVGISFIRKSILKKAKFDIMHNAPIHHAHKADAPILFAAAYGDDFIKLSHSEQLYQVYGGDKQIIRFEGDHNSERPHFFYDAVALFFYNVLMVGTQWEDPHAVNNFLLYRKKNSSNACLQKNPPATRSTKTRSSSTPYASRLTTASDENTHSHHPLSSHTQRQRSSSHPQSPLAHFSTQPSHSSEDPESEDEDAASVHNSHSFILSMLSSIRDELANCDDEEDRMELLQKLKEYQKKAGVTS